MELQILPTPQLKVVSLGCITVLIFLSVPLLQDNLPTCTPYVITRCESTFENNWCATIRAAIESKSDAEIWLSQYEKENSLDFRFRKSVKTENSERLVLKVISFSLHSDHQKK